MEEVLTALGWITVILLAVVGALAGWVAALVTRARNAGLYVVVGAVAAVLAPFVLVAVGLSALVLGGVLLTLVVGLVVAVIVVAIVRAIVK
jgi:uncharacterized membrane protein YeaQ/YmgE (transglycosylase-associated protein family)